MRISGQGRPRHLRSSAEVSAILVEAPNSERIWDSSARLSAEGQAAISIESDEGIYTTSNGSWEKFRFRPILRTRQKC